MPILPNGTTKTFKPPTGGSPRGWSFISTSIECWRKWAYRYVFNLFPVKVHDALNLGSAYHALMEGKTLEEVAKLFPDHVTDAKTLQDRRMKGPPLPANSEAVIEQEFELFDGLMTSKPDRIEKSNGKTIVRDFKTASSLSENDEMAWNVDGGILGECLAAETDTALVDIVLKYQPKTGSGVKVVIVKLTDEKRDILHATVRDFWEQAEQRTKLLARMKGKTVDLDHAFPRQLKSCVGKYGPCPYYARCWSKGSMESMQYKLVEDAPRKWAEYGAGLSWQKALDTAFAVGKKDV